MGALRQVQGEANAAYWVHPDHVEKPVLAWGKCLQHMGAQLPGDRQGAGRLFPGSTSLVTDGSGEEVAERRYKPWGELRYDSGDARTQRLYTGQIKDTYINLYYYGARYYDQVLGRFIQPDTVVPEPRNPQYLNRYSYCLNSPTNYTDPTGHYVLLEGDPGTPSEFAVLTSDTGEARWILHGGSHFVSYVDWTLAIFDKKDGVA